MREIDLQPEGDSLVGAITVLADDLGPGGASHSYVAHIKTDRCKPESAGEQVAAVEYQRGPRSEPGSTPGIVDRVLLAIAEDRLKCFQAGPFACGENDEALNYVRAAIAALKRRASRRSERGVLGKNIA